MLRRITRARSRLSPPAGFIQPCQPTLVAHPPAGPGWLHEMKHDSYRLMAPKDAESRAIAFDRAEQQLSARRI